MKSSTLLLFVFTLTLLGSTVAQSSVDDQIQTLQRQLPGRLESRDYDGAVEIGQKIAALEKSKGPAAKLSYIAALRNVATWQRLAFTNARQDLTRLSASRAEMVRRSEKATENFREIVELLLPMNEPDMLAAARFDLGAMLVGRILTAERCAEAEPHLRLVIDYENTKGRSNSATALASRMYSLDCRLYDGDFESAINDIENLIPSVAQAWKPEDKRLIPIYAVYSSLLMMSGKTDQAQLAAQKVRSISKRSEFEPDYTSLLSRRSVGKLDFTIGSPPRVMMGGSSISVPNPGAVAGGNPLAYRAPAYDPSNPRTIQDTWFGSAHSGRQNIPPSTTITTGVSGMVGTGERGHLIVVEVTVSETGNVIDTEARHPSEVVQKDIAKLAEKWRFRPLVLNGRAQKMVGLVTVAYYKKIEDKPETKTKRS